MVRPIDTDILDAAAHAEGVEPAVVVVRRAVPTMRWIAETSLRNGFGPISVTASRITEEPTVTAASAAVGSAYSLWYAEEPEIGDGLVNDYDGGPLANEDCRNLIVYLQRLGTSIGQWRQPLSAPTPPRHSPFDDAPLRPRRTETMRVHGFHTADAKRVEAAEKARAAWKASVAAWDRDHPILAQRREPGLVRPHASAYHRHSR